MQTAQDAAPDQALIARTNMVESQLRPNRVHDAALLTAMLNVPREAFVPVPLRNIAYADECLKIAPGRYLTEPLVTARLLDSAELVATDRVLVIGAGTGYTALIASMLAGKVVALEENEALRGFAAEVIGRFNRNNLTIQEGTLTRGCPAAGPYDVIVIDGLVAEVPEVILAQLAEGGRLVTVLLDERTGPHGVVMERAGSGVSARTSFDANLPPLPGFEPRPSFEFAP